MTGTDKDKDKPLRDSVKDMAGDVARDVSKAAREAGRETYGAARDTFGRAAEEARTMAQDEAGRRAEAGKAHLADEGRRLADSLHEAAGAQRRDSPRARILDRMAESVAEASDELRGQSVGRLLGEAEDFARRHPGAFVASAALLGFAATRFMRASPPATSAQSADRMTGELP